MKKKILFGLLAVLVLIQFIRPQRNQFANASSNDIAMHYPVPENIVGILKRACYDCHSNYTTYPWYTNIQPVGWWLQNHINEGKRELNFSEFATYTRKRKAHKMEEVAEMVEKGEMPLNSYTWIHKDAILTKEEASAVISWAKDLQKQIEQAP